MSNYHDALKRLSRRSLLALLGSGAAGLASGLIGLVKNFRPTSVL
jgi:hypothetical protein